MNDMMQKAQKSVNEFVNTLCEEYGFDMVLANPNRMYEWRDKCAEEGLDMEWIGFGSGATRYVMWDNNNKDFVIKLQHGFDDDIDYNRAEVETYEEAEARGLEQHFAWCGYVGERAVFDFYQDCDTTVKIFAMEYIDVDEDRTSEDSYQCQYKKFCEENDYDPADENVEEDFRDNYYDYEYATDEEGMLDLAQSIWGEQEVGKVVGLLKDFGIRDCHYGNWGYRDEELVLTDYASYRQQGGRGFAQWKEEEEEEESVSVA